MDGKVQPGDTPSPRADITAPRTFWIVGALIIGLLVAGYWFFIRNDYAPVLTDIAPEEAAEVVKVLDAKKIPYHLADGGTTILVERGQADKARLELIGSELPIRGQVGFELFNQSDMGLTEFAQKINFQRALQGELARTILLLDGIRSVRVHLGLAENRLFRGEQSPPKASVTLILAPGASLTESRVSGIQRLVAGAVPDMTPEAVAVLDGTGKVVSTDAVDQSGLPGSSDAVLENYRQRVTAAIRTSQPWLRFSVNISLRLRQSSQIPVDTNPATSRAISPRGEPDYVVNVRVTTPTQLDEQVRLELISTIKSAAEMDAAYGDSLVFLVGEPALPPVNPSPAARSDRVVAKTANLDPAPSSGMLSMPWLLAIGAGLVAIFLATVVIIERRRRGRAKDDELESFADQLRSRLTGSPEVPHGG
ncbi:flagellar basal-body MS-ring/collar protein FliF [Sphingomonas colocasiae]|uniref:Flagellar M-ring protein FliF n=1 Tax=Sphingomonas colocasiae TaxID=1848973 RepID=A0ABS7PWN3_9SPHN|nr:flagellar M-ring protein FliF [Sphingomonas colocasiae]